MSMVISFFVEGDPQGQPRHRSKVLMTRKQGRRGHKLHNYMPTTKFFMRVVRGAKTFISQYPDISPIRGPIHLDLFFRFGPAPAKAYEGPHISKPDADNLAKGVMDALTRANIWTDDCHVANLTVKKRYDALTSGVIITIVEEK